MLLLLVIFSILIFFVFFDHFCQYFKASKTFVLFFNFCEIVNLEGTERSFVEFFLAKYMKPMTVQQAQNMVFNVFILFETLI